MSIVDVDRTNYPDKGPRITPEAIEANIASEHYFTAAQGIVGADLLAGAAPANCTVPHPSLEILTICILVLQNGFTVTGESACAAPENFDAEIGKKVARQNAINKIWPLMGYELRSRMHAMKNVGGDLGEALTLMLAHRLGNPTAFGPKQAETILAHFENRALEEQGSN